ncbi:MAG: ATP-binding protein [Dissulfurispiraceae bacterium]|jgi:PAS domain S-box-containing protein|nr:ATP-binding protein [Dissulfurispiraceae bacterium]
MLKLINNPEFSHTRRFLLYSVSLLTLILIVSAAWNIVQAKRDTLEKAKFEARTIYDHNVAYKKWNAMLGGVYAEVSKKNQPNHYISPEIRELPHAGKQLALINHYQMTKSAYELMSEDKGTNIFNRVISLNPMNPSNKPDEWEKSALLYFEKGLGEFSEVAQIGGAPYLRVLKPYKMEKECLKCHEYQGYKIGDIRGGISIGVPMLPYLKSETITIYTIAGTHLAMWLIGFAGILFFSVRLMKNEKDRRYTEWKFKTLSDFAVNWEYWINVDGDIVYMSPSVLNITGYSVTEFMNNRELVRVVVHPEDQEAYDTHVENFALMDSGETEFRIITKDGQVKWISHICGPIYIDDQFLGRRITNRDVTDRKKLKAQLVQSQKMESLGLMAGNVAHDFNNILTTIMGFSALLKETVSPRDTAASRYIQNILSASDRAHALTNSLLTFSRKQIVRSEEMSIKTVVNEIEPMLRRLIGDEYELQICLSEDDYPVCVDKNQMEQVIMNIVTNARDSMPDGGLISIETTTAKADAEYASRTHIAQGAYMILSIADTGSGIDKKDVPHIFDPFFTTKEKGRGTGLGLSIVYGIIKQHNGFINVYSEPGTGTTFKIYLPVSDKTTGTTICSISDELFDDDLTGIGTILVAEDETGVRELLTEVLQRSGYSVITAADGEDAVREYRMNADKINLCILDVMMPRKNGKETYKILKTINPGVKVIFISGYTQNILSSKGIYEEGLVFIPKPLNINKLLSHVKAVFSEV